MKMNWNMSFEANSYLKRAKWNDWNMTGGSATYFIMWNEWNKGGALVNKY